MKRHLLGSTALIALSLGSMPALAELSLTLSGYYRFDAAYVSEKQTGDVAGVQVTTRNYDFSSRARLSFDAEGTADNGLRYGARIRFVNDSYTNNFLGAYDEAFGFVQGSFGRLAFGDIESAGTLLRIYAPDNAGTGIANGTWSNFTKGNTNFTQRVGGGTVGNSPNSSTIIVPSGIGGFRVDRIGPNAGASIFDDVLNGSDSTNSFSTKLVYTTTGINLSGFTFGVSFAPEVGNRGRNYDRNACDPLTGTCSSQDAAANFEDVVSAAVQYANTDIWNDIGFKAAAQLNWGNARNTNVKDLFAWMAGVQFTYGGFTLGGAYMDNGNSGSSTGTGVDTATSPGYLGTGIAYSDYAGYNVGLEYTVGPWTLGTNYFTQWVKSISTNVPFNYYAINAVGAGASYEVAPGLTAGGDVTYYWEDINNRAGIANARANSGYVAAVRTQVTF